MARPCTLRMHPYPIHAAFRNEDLDALLLCRLDCDTVNAVDENYDTPLRIAARKDNPGCNTTIMTMKVLQYGANISLTDHRGMNAVMLACEGDNDSRFGVLSALVSAPIVRSGQGILEARNNAGETAVMLAVLHNNPRCLQYLFDAGAKCYGTWTVGAHAGLNIFELARRRNLYNILRILDGINRINDRLNANYINNDDIINNNS